jgi:hypothetical protein
MGERIVSLLRDPEKASAMGAEGCRIVRQKFSPEAQLECTELLYDKLLTAARRGTGAVRQVVVSGSAE